MNDFTKKELQDIQECVNQFHNAVAKGGGDYYSELLNKIQLMLDNYDKNEQAWAYLDLLTKHQDAGR